MNNTSIKRTGLLLAGFAAGLLVSRLPHAVAASDPAVTDLSKKEFIVSIDEIRQNFVFGDPFVGHYYKTVTLSDGTTRRIELTPMVHRGRQVVEFKDNGFINYMGLDGTDTHGTLMVQIRDVATTQAQARAEGWPFPTLGDGRYPIPILPILPVRVQFQHIRGTQAEAMTVTNETGQPLNLFVAVFDAGKLVGARRIAVAANASSVAEAPQGWKKSSSPASSQPGQGPRAGDQVTLTEIPDQARSHERKYQDWRGAVP